MKSLLRRWFGSDNNPTAARNASVPAPVAEVDGKSFDIAATAKWHEGLPHPDWRKVYAWVRDFGGDRRETAFLACERAWLGMLAQALGPEYRMFESDHALVLSGRPGNEATAALDFVDGTRRRVRRLLEELAGDDTGKEVLLSFTDADTYSRYASYYCPSLDETMVSAGMFLHAGSEHFIVHGEHLWRIEPTIVHELTHAQLAHLKLPLWVNEGMAVNTEERLTRRGADAFEVKALEKKHAAHWTTDTIQQFWNGAAYKRDDDGSELAYDLGRLLVNGMCRDWSAFKRFAAAARAEDAGAQAAAECLHVDLGEAVRHFLKAGEGEWGPRPAAWSGAVAVETE
jgi:hypothetical protein